MPTATTIRTATTISTATTTTIENKSLTPGQNRRNQPRQALHHPLTSVIGLAILLHSLLEGQNTWKKKRLKLARSKLATILCRTPRRCSSPPSPPSRPPIRKYKKGGHIGKNHIHLYENIQRWALIKDPATITKKYKKWSNIKSRLPHRAGHDRQPRRDFFGEDSVRRVCSIGLALDCISPLKRGTWKINHWQLQLTDNAKDLLEMLSKPPIT